MKKSYLAFDLGAESGRAVLGKYDGSRLAIQEIHRFPNGPVITLGRMYWDVLYLFKEIKRGLSLAAREGNRQLAGVSCATWGVDFELLGKDDTLLGYPYHYRDSRSIRLSGRKTTLVFKESSPLTTPKDVSFFLLTRSLISYFFLPDLECPFITFFRSLISLSFFLISLSIFFTS